MRQLSGQSFLVWAVMPAPLQVEYVLGREHA